MRQLPLHGMLAGVAMLLFTMTIGMPLRAQNYAQETGEAEVHQRTTDSTLSQIYTGHFGWSISLPPEEIAKFNKIGSSVNESGKSEVVNFLLRGGRGGLKIRYYTEQRMIPLGYALLDSTIHYYEIDSAGRNGNIYRRTYVLTDQSVEIELLLTEKGEADLKESVVALFDSFVPPPSATFNLQQWRYGRNPEEYQEGRAPEDR
ncbi:MAG: hypothetical protein AB7H80_03290 [Candidatus Kapaibacterium sp.]